jgi:hypothetical protein
LEEPEESMNYYDTLIEVADDCPATEAQVPQAVLIALGVLGTFPTFFQAFASE